MKKTNFWKSLAMAVVALVSIFATSCSEEEIKFNGSDVVIPDPVVLPDAKAILSITVVDLEGGKTVGIVKTKDVTTSIGTSIEVECPENDGYTKAKAITVQIPSIEKGQTVVIPVTFYVVTLESAFSDLMEEATIQERPLVDSDNVELINHHELTFINENGWTDGVYTNTEANAVVSTARFGKYYTGYHYTTESIASRVLEHETTIEELLSYGMIFDEGIYEEEVVIPGLHIFTHEVVIQEIHIMEITLKNHAGDELFTATALKAGAVLVNGSATPITHNDPTHDDNSHDNSHGHGSGSNAGGGYGENTGE